MFRKNLKVCHLVLVVSTVAGNGYISEGEKKNFQSTSHLDQLSLSLQQSALGWLRPPPPGRFRDMSYLGYHRLEHALPPTPLPAVNRPSLVPTLPSVRDTSNRTKGIVSVAGNRASEKNNNASVIAEKKVQKAVKGSSKPENVGDSRTHNRKDVVSGKDGNKNSTSTKKEHREVIDDTGTHGKRTGALVKDDIPHLEVSESAHEPSYAAHAGYPARGGATSTGRVRIQVYRGPTKKVGYKYFAPWGYYVSQPSDDNKHSSYGYY